MLHIFEHADFYSYLITNKIHFQTPFKLPIFPKYLSSTLSDELDIISWVIMTILCRYLNIIPYFMYIFFSYLPHVSSLLDNPHYMGLLFCFIFFRIHTSIMYYRDAMLVSYFPLLNLTQSNNIINQVWSTSLK